jgi:putative FmdB family regulatory protein
MPIYEYRCLKCEKDFEAIVFGGNDTVICPHCNGDKLERLMSSFGFKSGGKSRGENNAPAPAASSGCASCSGGDCSSCK